MSIQESNSYLCFYFGMSMVQVNCYEVRTLSALNQISYLTYGTHGNSPVKYDQLSYEV